jgi:hypothetical protein
VSNHNSPAFYESIFHIKVFFATFSINTVELYNFWRKIIWAKATVGEIDHSSRSYKTFSQQRIFPFLLLRMIFFLQTLILNIENWKTKK